MLPLLQLESLAVHDVVSHEEGGEHLCPEVVAEVVDRMNSNQATKKDEIKAILIAAKAFNGAYSTFATYTL